MVKFSRGQIDHILSYFSQENRIWQFLQIDFLEDNLHEMSNAILWEKYFKMLSGENFTQHAN